MVKADVDFADVFVRGNEILDALAAESPDEAMAEADGFLFALERAEKAGRTRLALTAAGLRALAGGATMLTLRRREKDDLTA